MNLGWFGVPPSGGSNGLDRPKPGLQAFRGCMVPMHGHKTVKALYGLVSEQFFGIWNPGFPGKVCSLCFLAACATKRSCAAGIFNLGVRKSVFHRNGCKVELSSRDN